MTTVVEMCISSSLCL